MIYYDQTRIQYNYLQLSNLGISDKDVAQQIVSKLSKIKKFLEILDQCDRHEKASNQCNQLASVLGFEDVS